MTVPEIDSAGAVTYWYTHGIISDTSYRGIMDNCDFEAIYPLDREVERASHAAFQAAISSVNESALVLQKTGFMYRFRRRVSSVWSSYFLRAE